MYYIYILESTINHSYYIGLTNNVKRRSHEHNRGLSKSTKSHKPWILKYFEKYNNINEAYKREKYLKSLKKKDKIDKIISG